MFSLLSKTRDGKKRHIRARDYYNLWKTKKTMKRKIKIMLINI